jgi:hypothetical protein
MSDSPGPLMERVRPKYSGGKLHMPGSGDLFRDYHPSSADT